MKRWLGNAVYLKVPDYADSVSIGKVTGNGRNDLVVDGTFGNEGYLWMFPQGGTASSAHRRSSP